jgi:pimeloyl-ACP methyl ester carboxylesterase
MLFDNPVNSAELGAWLAQAIKDLQTGTDINVIRNRYTAITGGLGNMFMLPGDNQGPTAWAFKNPTRSLILINCTESITQAIGLWNAYTESLGLYVGGNGNDYLIRRAFQIVDAVRNAFNTNINNCIIAGHSQGGAIAWLAAQRMDIFAGVTAVKGISFGAPKPVDAGFRNPRPNTPFCRWMNSDDPVPLLPPATMLPAQMAALGVPGVARRLVNFRQPAGGVVLNEDGTTTTADLPTVATLPAIANFSAWLLNANQGAIASHQLNTYVNRLNLFIGSHPRPAQDRPPMAGPEPVNPLSRADVARAQREGVRAVFAVGEAQQARALVIPPSSLFSAFRTGPIWYVALGGQTIAVGPTRKRALGMKNFGNSLLKRLQRAGYVDTATLTAQLGAYFLAAQTNTGVFVPPMQVVLPA